MVSRNVSKLDKRHTLRILLPSLLSLRFNVPPSMIRYSESGFPELDPKVWALILVGVNLVKVSAMISLVLALLASVLEAVLRRTSLALCILILALLPLKVARVLASLFNLLAGVRWAFGGVWADVDLQRIDDPVGEDVIASATWRRNSTNIRTGWGDTDTGTCGSARSSGTGPHSGR